MEKNEEKKSFFVQINYVTRVVVSRSTLYLKQARWYTGASNNVLNHSIRAMPTAMFFPPGSSFHRPISIRLCALGPYGCPDGRIDLKLWLLM